MTSETSGTDRKGDHRLDLVDALAEDIAHTINNHACSALLYVETARKLLEGQTTTSITTCLEGITRGIEQSHQLMRSMLQLCQPSAGAAQSCDVNRLVTHARDFNLSRSNRLKTPVLLDLEPNLPPITASPAEMTLVVFRALQSAIGTTGTTLRVLVATRRAEATVEIVVTRIRISGSAGWVNPFDRSATAPHVESAGRDLEIIHSHRGEVFFCTSSESEASLRIVLPIT